MRIRIVLALENIALPIDYHSSLVGVIYNMLPINDETKNLHNNGEILNKRKYKLFTFSELYGPSTYIEKTKQLLFSGNGCFDVTSFKEEMLINILSYLENNKTIMLKNNIIKVVKYDILNDTLDTKKEKTYYTVSPITIYKTIEKKNYFYKPTDEEFKEKIINNLASKYYLCYKKNMPELEITSFDRIKRKIVKFRKTSYEAYHLTISFSKLTSEIQNVIMTCGLGPKNSLGFGMVSIKKWKKEFIYLNLVI